MRLLLSFMGENRASGGLKFVKGCSFAQPVMCSGIIHPDGMPTSLARMFWLAIGTTRPTTPLQQKLAIIAPGILAAPLTYVSRLGISIAHFLHASRLYCLRKAITICTPRRR